MTDLDDIDCSILSELQKDGSLSADRLSERIHLSRNACWRRVRTLEDNGVLRARVALVDAAAAGCPLSVLIFVRAANHGPDWREAFARAVLARPEVVGAYRTSGDIDYVLKARVADVDAYDRLYQALTADVPLADVSASFVMEEIKDTTAVPLQPTR
jgi:Lrp/AsnC family transcriptional regulator